MARRISDKKRAKILADLQSGQQSQAAVARRHGVSASTVRKIAKDAAPAAPPPFNAKTTRARLIQDLYADAQKFRERSWSPYTQVVVGQSGPELVTTKLPPLRDQQAGYAALLACINQALRLEQADTGDSVAEAKSLLAGLSDALGVAASALESGDGSQPGG
ncbi:transposase family protein [Actinoallomurus sp. NPDC052274]|uniref:transposase family protein n=1 Tax=Actinoallomurus sp. NPDC052274 TaxID=3155420 RepID=UPI0034400EC6